MGTFNDLTANDIITNMKSFMGNLYSKGLILSALKRINAFNLIPRKQCTDEDFEIIKRNLIKVNTATREQSNDVDYDTPVESLNDDSEQVEDNEEKEVDVDSFDSDVENKINSFFPDVWIYDDFISTDHVTTKSYKMPDSITTWKLSGFTLHRDFGIAIAAPQQVSVEKNYLLIIEMPRTLKEGEKCYVKFNFKNKKSLETATIQIKSEPSDLLDYMGKDEHKISSKNDGQFIVHANKTGIAKIYVTALINGIAVDEVQQEIIIIPNKIIIEKSETTLVNLTTINSYKTDFNITIPQGANLVKAGIILSGNMFGPIIKNLIEK